MTKYLIFIASGIGDFLVAVPMIHTIKQVQPDAIIDIFTCSDQKRFGLTHMLARLQGDVRRAYYYSVGEKLHSLKMLASLGYKQYDYGIVLEHSNSHYVSTWPSRIVRFASKTTVGAHNPHNAATYDITLERPDSYSVYDLQDDLLRAVGLEQSVRNNVTYDLYDVGDLASIENLESAKHIAISGNLESNVDPASTEFTRPTKSIIFCIGAGNAASEDKYGIPSLKSWPVDRWITVANRLAEDGYDIHLIGGAMEQKLIESYQHNINPHIHNDIGAFTIKDSLQAVKQADLVVGVDTGMIHGAALQGTPTLTLFGCSDHIIEQPFGPYSRILRSGRHCSPCLGTPQSHHCHHNACMTDISVDEVYANIMNMLNVNC